MTTPERQLVPEKIPFLVMEAAKHVPVNDYLQLRFQKGHCSDREYGQMLDGADVIRELAEGEGKMYKLGDQMNFSIDPKVILARQILTKLSVPEYLAARQAALEGQLAWNFEKIEVLGEQDLIEKGKRMTQELLVTRAVAEAIKTTPASPQESNPAYRIFREQLELVKSGKRKRLELATFTKDMERQWSLLPPEHNVEDGEICFSEEEAKAAIQRLFNELTGKVNDWESVDKSPIRYNETWEMPTLVNKVRIGIDKEVDGYGERKRTYYLFHNN